VCFSETISGKSAVGMLTPVSSPRGGAPGNIVMRRAVLENAKRATKRRCKLCCNNCCQFRVVCVARSTIRYTEVVPSRFFSCADANKKYDVMLSKITKREQRKLKIVVKR